MYIWSNNKVMWVSDDVADKIFVYLLPTQADANANSNFYFSEDSTLKDLKLSRAVLTSTFSATNRHYTALVDHTSDTATVTATPNDLGSTVNIFRACGTTKVTARKSPQVSLREGYNAVVAKSRTTWSIYLIRVTKSEAPPVSSCPLLLPPSFQASAASGAGQEALAGSSTGLGE